MNWFLIFGMPIVLLACWLYTVQITKNRIPILRNKAIVLLIAHPDDEAMFFAPTLLALTREDLGNHVKILCLSSGNADGIGETRKKEIGKSGELLGLRSEKDVVVYEHPAFPDSMTATWDAVDIAKVLDASFLVPDSKTPKGKVGKKTPSSAGGKPTPTTIDVLITFDKTGISSHPNHISLYYGAKFWLKEMMKDKSGWECPVTLYTLTSTNIMRKYMSFLDMGLTMVITALGSIRTTKKKMTGLPTRLMFLSDTGGYRQAQVAMTQAHRSQMRWFRWGWIVIGRYMIVNDLKREI